MSTHMFESVPLPKIPRSYSDYSYSNLFTARFGNIYPIQTDEVVPGDTWNMENSVVIRPYEGSLFHPIMHEVDAHVASFFVPYRLLQGQQSEYDARPGEQSFEDMITGGRNGDLKITPPHWPSSMSRGYDNSGDLIKKPQLSDYFHIPRYNHSVVTSEYQPTLYPFRAYRFIYNCYFRDANLEDEIPVVFADDHVRNYDEILTCCWQKDKFTSALPDTQRGPLPTIPFTGSAPVTGGQDAVMHMYIPRFSGDKSPISVTDSGLEIVSGNATGWSVTNGVKFDNLSASFDSLPVLTIPDLRNTIAVQHVLERSMLFGPRYNEYLLGQFGICPRDDTLQRPIFIGGHTTPIYFDEVTQTSSDLASTDKETLGRQAGTFMALGGQKTCNFTVKEYGLIMTVLFIRPKATYRGGMNRQFYKPSRWSFMNPEFARLTECAIFNGEVSAYTSYAEDNQPELKPGETLDHPDLNVFGYQGMYDEYRWHPDVQVENYEDSVTADQWTLARKFANTPVLNERFLHVHPDEEYLTAPFTSKIVPPFIVHVYNKIGAIRPLPMDPTPGLTRI